MLESALWRHAAIGRLVLEGFRCFLAEFDDDVIHEVIDYVDWRARGQFGCCSNFPCGRVHLLFNRLVMPRRNRQRQPILEAKALYRAPYAKLLVGLKTKEVEFTFQSALASSLSHVDPD